MVGSIVTTLVVLAATMWFRRDVEGSAGLKAHLEDLGRVAVVGDWDLLRLGTGRFGRGNANGYALVAASSVPGLDQALDGTDEAALAERLTANGIAAILADGRHAVDEPRTLREKLAAYRSFEQLQAVYLAPAAGLYVPRTGLVLQPPNDFALAYVARGILGGARPPRVSSFPEPLRRIRNVEVMVMLRDGETARLWRSARGSSIARALVTASIVARQRWNERQASMGGPIDSQLASLDVDVFLLDEDGTLGSHGAGFVERAFTPEHGVAYDHLGAWRYLLPDATREKGEGSAVRGYAALFEESDMPEDSLERDDVRLYRLLARLLARSSAPSRSGASLGGASAPAASAGRRTTNVVPVPVLDLTSM